MKRGRAIDQLFEAMLLGLGYAVAGATVGLLLGGAVQLLLHLFGVGPRLSDNHTDWYIVVPGLLGAGAGLTFGVQYGPNERAASRSEKEIAKLKQEIAGLEARIVEPDRDDAH